MVCVCARVCAPLLWGPAGLLCCGNQTFLLISISHGCVCARSHVYVRICACVCALLPEHPSFSCAVAVKLSYFVQQCHHMAASWTAPRLLHSKEFLYSAFFTFFFFSTSTTPWLNLKVVKWLPPSVPLRCAGCLLLFGEPGVLLSWSTIF